jgi:hypothetical protein
MLDNQFLMVLGNNTNELRIHVNTRHDANVANLISTPETLLFCFIYTCLLPAYIIHPSSHPVNTTDEVIHTRSIHPLESDR